MKVRVVRYQAKDGSGDENEGLIKAVFHELEAKAPSGLRYVVLRLGDGTFVHFAIVDESAKANPLLELDAFRAFQKGIGERCKSPPEAQDAVIVGNYGMLG